MPIGFQGPGGTEGAYAALQRLVDDARTRKILEERLKEGEFSRGFRTRVQDENERGNKAGEKFEGDRVDIARGHLGIAGNADARAGARQDRDFATEDKNAAGLESTVGGITDPALLTSVNLERYGGIKTPRSVHLTPIQRGTEAGLEVGAGWDAGGKRVAEGEASIADSSMMKRINWQGDRDLKNISARDAAQGGAASAQNQQDIQLLAKSVLENPDNLDKLPQVDRKRVLIELERQDSPIANIRKEKAEQLQKEVRDALTDLDNTPGKAGAVGWVSLDPRSWPRVWGGKPPAGSPQAAFQYKVNQIVNLMTLPRLELMRGTGPLSNADIEMLRRSATTLSTATDEASFNRELDKIKRQFFGGGGDGGLTPEQTAEIDSYVKTKRGGGTQ